MNILNIEELIGSSQRTTESTSPWQALKRFTLKKDINHTTFTKEEVEELKELYSKNAGIFGSLTPMNSGPVYILDPVLGFRLGGDVFWGIDD